MIEYLFFSVKKWGLVFILNVIFFNILYSIKVEFSDATGFALYGSILFSVIAFLISSLLTVFVLYFFNKNRVVLATLNFLMGLVIYICVIEIVYEPFIEDYIFNSFKNEEFKEMNYYYYSILLFSFVGAYFIGTIWQSIKAKSPAPRDMKNK